MRQRPQLAGRAAPGNARPAAALPGGAGRRDRRADRRLDVPRGRRGRDDRPARAQRLRRLSGPRRVRDRAARGRKLRDGWLDTGDLGAVDDEGFVRLAGRAKDLIIRGGHNIDPATIEDALLAHPAVAAAGAVGRPDAHAGEVPVAFVALTPGARSPSPSWRPGRPSTCPSAPPRPGTSRSSTRSPSPPSASRTSPNCAAVPPSRPPRTRSPGRPCTTGCAPCSSTGRWRSSSRTRPTTRPCARCSPPTR